MNKIGEDIFEYYMEVRRADVLSTEYIFAGTKTKKSR